MKLKNIKNKPQLDENIFENKVDYFYNNYSDGKLILRDALKKYYQLKFYQQENKDFQGQIKPGLKEKVSILLKIIFLIRIKNYLIFSIIR